MLSSHALLFLWFYYKGTSLDFTFPFLVWPQLSGLFKAKFPEKNFRIGCLQFPISYFLLNPPLAQSFAFVTPGQKMIPVNVTTGLHIVNLMANSCASTSLTYQNHLMLFTVPLPETHFLWCPGPHTLLAFSLRINLSFLVSCAFPFSSLKIFNSWVLQGTSLHFITSLSSPTFLMISSNSMSLSNYLLTDSFQMYISTQDLSYTEDFYTS